jgi:hypothetical protein
MKRSDNEVSDPIWVYLGVVLVIAFIVYQFMVSAAGSVHP